MRSGSLTHTRAKGHVMDGSSVAAVDLLQRPVAAGVPDGDGPIFTAGHQQSPRWIQTDGVHLYMHVRDISVFRLRLHHILFPPCY